MKLVNRAKMTITAVASSGTGTLTLGAASTGGFSTFADAGVSNGETVRYTIEGPNNLFEIGSGVYTASGTTLSRTPSESSNANNSAITATTDSVVFVTAAAADIGPVVHANVTSLLAQTGMVTGDTALVTSSNKLFMYTSTGWFLIATLTNTSPSAITGAAASYELAADGTATVITLAATDPEGFPITFSQTVSTGTLGSTATVAQGTGASANVFTITPSSNSAHAGSFSITFSASDGNSVSQAISAFTLAFGYDLSSATYDNLSFYVANQADNPTGLAFNSDGTKMFVVGPNDIVYQYALTNGFSMASGNVSYSNLSFSVTSQETAPGGLAFNSDGTKMFVIGSGSDSVHQYSLTNGFDLSSGNVSYSNLSFSVASQETAPFSLAFNSDGTKMFITGYYSAGVSQYSLTNGFDLSSGNVSYDNISFSVSSKETAPRGLAFNSAGTKMFITGNVSDSVHQYVLTNGFSMASGNVSFNDSFNVQSQEGTPQDLAFNFDGTKMFVIGSSSDSVHQYDVES
jgi:sugar lactone lactonase YvrE